MGCNPAKELQPVNRRTLRPNVAADACTIAGNGVFLAPVGGHPIGFGKARCYNIASAGGLTPSVARAIVRNHDPVRPPPSPHRNRPDTETETMNIQRAVQVQPAGNLPMTALSGDGLESYDGFRDNGLGGLPEGWQQFATDVAESRLYCITPPNGGDIQWQAEITHHGEVKYLRCFSELRARAWLAVWDKPRFALTWETPVS